MMLTSKNRTGGASAVLAVLLVVVITVAIALAVWRPWVGRKNSGDPAPCDESAFKEIRQRALELQGKEKWCEAKAAWNNVKKELTEANACGTQKEEAEANLRIASERCETVDTGVTKVELPSDPKLRKRTPPEMVPEDRLLVAYPVGRKVRSLGITDITGQGENRYWGVIHGKKNFAYQYRVVVETEVTENTGTRLGCEIRFKDVHQIRAVATRTLTLEPPKSPVLEVIWDQVDDKLRIFPPYLIVRKVQELLDPKLEISLNAMADTFFPPEKNDEIVALFDQFSGLHIQAEYISGLGVTKLEEMGGKKFKQDDLEALAYNLSLVMDYFVGTVADAKVGEQRTLKAEDLVGMLGTGYDMSARGTLVFAKTKDAQSGSDKVELEVRGGEVLMEGRVGGAKRTGTIRPKSGRVVYLPDQRLISLAKIDWEAGVDWVPESNLLFGTTGVVNLKMMTYYEAQRLDQQAATKQVKP